MMSTSAATTALLLLLLLCMTTCTANQQDDPPLECGLYLAESSIPNSGWGMYTGIPRAKEQGIGPSDVVINVADYTQNQKNNKNPVKRWLMHEYYWFPRWGGSHFQANEVDTIIAGLGMLANSHMGLVNALNRGPQHVQGVSDRSQPQSGAYTYHTHQLFSTNQNLPAGMEIFVSYGDDWFEERSHIFGDDLPLSEDFKKADALLQKFFQLHGTEDMWQSWLRDSVENNQDLTKRTKRAVPSTFQEAWHIRTKLKGSTAMHTVPNAIRSIDWLNENGFCLDHIQMEDSTIERAGKGGFASRDLPKGTIVAPAPLVHLHRKHLDVVVADEHDSSSIYHRGHQLLYNYVYGHPSTSLVFYPYAPATNVINHSKEPNVRLRWSNRMTRPDWLNLTTTELVEINSKTGLMMEFVAIRDIQEGEEILLDYGNNWQEAWDKHVQEWQAPPSKDDYIPAHVLDQENVIRTVYEEPYPRNVKTTCWYDELEDPPKNSDSNVYRWTTSEYVEDEMTYYRHTDETYDCDILTRSGSTYTAKIMTEDEDGTQVEKKVRGIPREAIFVADLAYTGDAYLRNAFRHYIEMPGDMIPRSWRDLEQAEEKDSSLCQLYVAESSIPNSGLGMYTAVDIPQNQQIFYDDVVIQVEDVDLNKKLRQWHDAEFEDDETAWLLDSYYWNADNTKGEFEATDVQSIVPGLGMLANSHTGLVNALMHAPRIDLSGLDRNKDPGAGCTTIYHGVGYRAKSLIPSGMELFVGYGDNWFKDRTESLGMIPLSGDFKKADKLLERYWRLVKGQPNTEFGKDLWKLVWYNGTIQNDNDNRVRIALPRKLSEVKEVVDKGTALSSVPNAVRAPEWLKEKGVCLDNIRPDKSTIPQAGKGAFATRSIAHGSVIAPLPFVHVHRRHMDLYDSDDTNDANTKPYFTGKQLLLNYCYGNSKSNLLLFPYSPVSNYINHHHTEFNAELRWSSLPNHRTDWMEWIVEALMDEPHAGLIMEIVATRDIEEGEEVFLDYGKDWEQAWNAYVQNWNSPEDSDYVPAVEFNDFYVPVRTLDEDPYPDNVQTVCYISDLDNRQTPAQDEEDDYYEWEYMDELYDDSRDAYRCDVLSRNDDLVVATDNTVTPQETYTARVHRTNTIDWIVTDIPRRAIEFVDDEYTSDMFLRDAFRHEIGIPDDLFPAAWMDLTEED